MLIKIYPGHDVQELSEIARQSVGTLTLHSPPNIDDMLALDRFNQTVLAYDATKEEKLEALKAKKAQVEERLREKS